MEKLDFAVDNYHFYLQICVFFNSFAAKNAVFNRDFDFCLKSGKKCNKLFLHFSLQIFSTLVRDVQRYL